MKVLVLTQWYPPEPVLLIQELAQTLQKSGHGVTVLTGFPNYPSGKIYPGYHIRLIQREILNDIPVVRVPLYPEHSLSGLWRILNYVSFALASSILGFFVTSKPDVIFVYHPPLTIGLPAFVLSRLWGVPFVYQIQDMWPETLRATGMMKNARLLRWVGRFARWIYKKAHTILVISPGFRRNLIDKGVPEPKIRVVSNWIDTGVYKAIDCDHELAEKLGLYERFNIMYAGNMGEAQGLETVLEAAALLSDIQAVQFVLFGEGTALPRLKRFVEEKDLKNVRFMGRYPHQTMPSLYALADILLVHLKDDPLFRITIPSKTLAYLASGKPIIVAATGDVADMINSAGAGIACPPGDPQALAESVRHLYQMTAEQRWALGERGRQIATREYDRDILIPKIEQELLIASVTRTQ
jgi:glycosyltransferase involved in cell wall biosynthesis